MRDMRDRRVFWTERADIDRVDVTDEERRRIAHQSGLTEETIADVVYAINAERLADPIGFVRKHPRGIALAIRVPNLIRPYEVVWISGNGGSCDATRIHTWPPLVQNPESD